MDPPPPTPPAQTDTEADEIDPASSISSGPTREVTCADALQWLKTRDQLPCVVTSLPDITESRQRDQWADRETYKSWFVATCKEIISRLRPGCAAVFYQTDAVVVPPRQHRCTCYIDKSFLCMLAAHEAGSETLWHKVALRNKVGTIRHGAPTYTHMICVASPHSASFSYDIAACRSCPDVMDRGDVSWSKGSGVKAMCTVIRWLQETLGAAEILDPFAGEGNILAAANYQGLDACGVDVSEKRCRMARTLQVVKKDGALRTIRASGPAPESAPAAQTQSQSQPRSNAGNTNG